jgi:tetratricopeptide (TPR) repeat protein
MELVWEDTPPPGAVNTLQSHVSHLRDMLTCRTAILARRQGYVLDIGDEATDLLCAERVVQEGLESSDPAARQFDTAHAWFVAEHAALRRIIDTAATDSRDTHAWQLGWAFSWYLLRQGHRRERVTVQQMALAAAERIGDRTGRTVFLEGLARSHTRLGALDDARTVYQQALTLNTGLGDPAGQAHNHMGLAYIADQQGRHTDASWHEEQSLTLASEANSPRGVGWVLYGRARVASHHSRPEAYEQALEYCLQAMKLLAEQGHQDGQAAMWDSLGYIHRGLGNFTDAIDCHEKAVEMTRQIGDRYMEAEALLGTGDTYHAAGNPDDARKAWRASLILFEELNHRQADSVRTKLTADAGGSLSH